MRGMDLEHALIEVWRQTLVEQRSEVELDGARFPVRQTSKSHLRQVDFQWDGQGVRGLEQNPRTDSRWAKLAREGRQVMQFLAEGRYFANVVDGKATFYGKRAAHD
jgi:hypothetical protein